MFVANRAQLGADKRDSSLNNLRHLGFTLWRRSTQLPVKPVGAFSASRTVVLPKSDAVEIRTAAELLF